MDKLDASPSTSDSDEPMSSTRRARKHVLKKKKKKGDKKKPRVSAAEEELVAKLKAKNIKLVYLGKPRECDSDSSDDDPKCSICPGRCSGLISDHFPDNRPKIKVKPWTEEEKNRIIWKYLGNHDCPFMRYYRLSHKNPFEEKKDDEDGKNVEPEAK